MHTWSHQSIRGVVNATLEVRCHEEDDARQEYLQLTRRVSTGVGIYTYTCACAYTYMCPYIHTRIYIYMYKMLLNKNQEKSLPFCGSDPLKAEDGVMSLVPWCSSAHGERQHPWAVRRTRVCLGVDA